jgi:hypothetical protein
LIADNKTATTNSCESSEFWRVKHKNCDERDKRRARALVFSQKSMNIFI